MCSHPPTSSPIARHATACVTPPQQPSIPGTWALPVPGCAMNLTSWMCRQRASRAFGTMRCAPGSNRTVAQMCPDHGRCRGGCRCATVRVQCDGASARGPRASHRACNVGARVAGPTSRSTSPRAPVGHRVPADVSGGTCRPKNERAVWRAANRLGVRGGGLVAGQLVDSVGPPSFETAEPLAPGSCRRELVSFVLPVGAHPIAIRYALFLAYEWDL